MTHCMILGISILQISDQTLVNVLKNDWTVILKSWNIEIKLLSYIQCLIFMYIDIINKTKLSSIWDFTINFNKWNILIIIQLDQFYLDYL